MSSKMSDTDRDAGACEYSAMLPGCPRPTAQADTDTGTDAGPNPDPDSPETSD